MAKLEIYFLVLGGFLVSTLHAQTPCEVYTEKYECEPETSRFKSKPFVSQEPLDCASDLVATTIDLMERGDKEIELSEKDEAIMLIGTTGTGKSTLTYFLAGNNSRMISYKKSTGTYLIKDCNGKISGNSTIVSATIFPDLVVQESTNTAFYDNPGFQDTRTPCIEIANAYFMTKIANHLKRVKFVIVINNNAVVPGADRIGLISMLKGVLSFVPNVEKFGEGLALVATKLKFDAGELIEDPYIADAKIFLTENRPGLKEIFADEDELRKVEFIIDTLANQDAPNKIGMFRTPTDCGLLSQLENMQDNRNNMSHVIMNNLKFIETTPTDFGFSLSADAKMAVRNIGEQLNNDILAGVYQFSQEIFNYLLRQFSCISTDTCSKLIAELNVLFSNPDFLNEYADEDSWKNLNFSSVVDRLTRPEFMPTDLTIAPGLVENLKKMTRYLEFLISFEDLRIDVITWLSPMKSINGNLRTHIAALASSMDQTVQNVIKSIANPLYDNYVFQLNQLEAGDYASVNVTQFNQILTNLYAAVYSLVENPNLPAQEYMNEIIENIQTFNERIGEQELLKLKEYSEHLDFLKSISGDRVITFNPKSWIIPLLNLKTDLTEFVTQTFAPAIYGQIKTLLEIFSEDLATLKIKEFNQIPDVFERQSKYLKYLDELTQLQSKIRSILRDMKLRNFLLEVIDGFHLIGMESQNSQTKKSILEKIPLLGLMDTMKYSTVILEENREDWLTTLIHGNYLILDEKYWTEFLINTFSDLSTLDVQTLDKFGYKNWWSSLTEEISNSTLGSAWDKLIDVPTIKAADYDQILRIANNDPVLKFKSLNLLLKSTLEHGVKCEQDGATSIGRGRFVSTTQIMKECVQAGLTKKVVILSESTLYLDDDIIGTQIDEKNNIDMFVMSPTWWMKYERIIDLDGLHGQPPASSPGSVGNPGGKAGNFIGIGQHFIKGQLQVKASGGTGGAGRDGKDGVNGRNGNPSGGWCECKVGMGGPCKFHADFYTCSDNAETIAADVNAGWCYANNDGVWFNIRGEPGESATRPIAGGKGALGGAKGNIIMAELSDISSGNVRAPLAIPGTNGTDGRGGRGATGGFRGDVYNVRGDDRNNRCEILETRHTRVNEQSECFDDTPDGGNSEGLQPPKPQVFDPVSFSPFINQFIEETKQLISNEFFKYQLTDFVKRVESSEILP